MTICQYCEFGIHAPIAPDCPNHKNRNVRSGVGPKLYKVHLEYDLMVLADDEYAAVKIAEHNAGESSEFPPDGCQVAEVTEERQIPGEWKGCLPYTGRGEKNEKRCIELIRAAANEKSSG